MKKMSEIFKLPLTVAQSLDEGAADANEGAAAVARVVNAHDDLVEALEMLLERYTSMVKSGDGGYWDPETDAEVIKARAALKKAEA